MFCFISVLIEINGVDYEFMTEHREAAEIELFSPPPLSSPFKLSDVTQLMRERGGGITYIVYYYKLVREIGWNWI
jgi:hypothetical protein